MPRLRAGLRLSNSRASPMPRPRHSGLTASSSNSHSSSTDRTSAKPTGAASILAMVSQVPGRSEEHTSELQSLMRISYPVFCLKQKSIKKYRQQHHQTEENLKRHRY